MKAALIATITTFFVSALAVPTLKVRQTDSTTTTTTTAATITIQLSNDQTGANDNELVPVGCGPISFGSLFGASVLAQDGTVVATSVQNVTPASSSSVSCSITDDTGAPVSLLNSTLTYVDLDGDNTVAIPTNVTLFAIDCQLQ